MGKCSPFQNRQRNSKFLLRVTTAIETWEQEFLSLKLYVEGNAKVYTKNIRTQMFSLLSFLFSYPRISTRLSGLYQQWIWAHENLLQFFFSSNYRLLSCVLSNDPLYLKELFFFARWKIAFYSRNTIDLLWFSSRGGKAKKSDVRKTHSLSNRVSLILNFFFPSLSSDK